MESSREIPELQDDVIETGLSSSKKENTALAQTDSVIEKTQSSFDRLFDMSVNKIGDLIERCLDKLTEPKQESNPESNVDEEESGNESIQEETSLPVVIEYAPVKKRQDFQLKTLFAPLVELARGETVQLWTPAPISEPVVDNELLQMPALERVTEVWRYSILSGEYALSPNGLLREWFKLVLKVALLLMIPVFIFVPIITIFMASSSSIAGYLVDITGNILWSFINLLLLALVICAAGVLFVVFPKVLRWLNRR